MLLVAKRCFAKTPKIRFQEAKISSELLRRHVEWKHNLMHESLKIRIQGTSHEKQILVKLVFQTMLALSLSDELLFITAAYS